MSYPILLNLRGRRVVVVGGGKVGTRKVIDLLNEKALVAVISPTLHPDLALLSDQIDVHPTPYSPGMLESLSSAEQRPVLVFAATDNPEVNRQVAGEARALNILVSLANGGASGDFSSMTAIHRGEIMIAISTGGASPALAAHLRDKLEAHIGEEYVTLARWLGELRPLVKAQIPAHARRDLWRAIIASSALDCLRSGDEAGARAIIDALIAQAISQNPAT
ncbi:MAG: bifunctional precorrin-2 dehydrogenase/sirohydrochlorin ferrochelatase [Chloroflexota bacterium]